MVLLCKFVAMLEDQDISGMFAAAVATPPIVANPIELDLCPPPKPTNPVRRPFKRLKAAKDAEEVAQPAATILFFCCVDI